MKTHFALLSIIFLSALLVIIPGNVSAQIDDIATPHTLYSIHFIDDNIGWAGGNDGLLIHTTDGGDTWSPQDTGLGQTNDLFSVYFTDSTHGWVTSVSGKVSYTTDGGDTWKNSPVVFGDKVSDITLRSIHFTDSTHGWAVGDKGTVIHTTNGGVFNDELESQSVLLEKIFDPETSDDDRKIAISKLIGDYVPPSSWTEQTSGVTDKTLFSVYFIDNNNGWAVGESGTILRTVNGGASWIAQTIGDKDLTSVYFIDSNNGWAVGDRGTIIHTTNAGVNWSPMQSSTNTDDLTSVHFTDSNNGWAVGYPGTVLRTTDAGDNWTTFNFETGSFLLDVHFVDSGNGWILNDKSEIIDITSLDFNQPPIASAGSHVNIGERTHVTLDGSGSSDPDGDTLSYSWTQIGEPSVTLSNSDTVSPTFTAPDVTGETLLTFELTVTDNGSVPKSNTDTVSLIITNVNRSPTANAGSDQIVDGRVTVTLDGSGSSDPDGDTLSYSWTQIGEPSVLLTDSSLLTANNPPSITHIASPAFTAPVVTSPITLTFELTVTDNVRLSTLSSDPDTVTITINPPNSPPSANAGPDQLVESSSGSSGVSGSDPSGIRGAVDEPEYDQTSSEMSRITLDGTKSSDPDGTIDSYKWTLVSGTHYELKGFAENDASTTFSTPPTSAHGATLVFSLVVTDDDGTESTPDEVIIRVTSHNVQPIAHAGADQSVGENTLVTLDGTGSSDPDGDTLSYSWTLTEFPTLDSSLEIQQLSDSTIASPTFTAPEVVGGISLVYTLTVTDNAEAPKSHTDTVRININNVVGGSSAADDDGGVTGASEASASIIKVYDGSKYVDFADDVIIQTGIPKFKGTSDGINSVKVMIGDSQVGGNKISSDATFVKGWKHAPLPNGTYTITVTDNVNYDDILFTGTIIIEKDGDNSNSGIAGT